MKLIREVQRVITTDKEKKNTTLTQQKLNEAVLLFEAEEYNKAKKIVLEARELLENAPLLNTPKKKSYLWMLIPATLIVCFAIFVSIGKNKNKWPEMHKKRRLFKKNEKLSKIYEKESAKYKELNTIFKKTIDLKKKEKKEIDKTFIEEIKYEMNKRLVPAKKQPTCEEKIQELNKIMALLFKKAKKLDKNGTLSKKDKEDIREITNQLELAKALAEAGSDDALLQLIAAEEKIKEKNFIRI